jgi:RNA polymerase sigma-70 factor, ECF subfamily
MFGLEKKLTDYTDEHLMQLIVSGDSVAFNHLYKRYNQRLIYYFYRMLGNSNEKARDFLQDVFIKLIDKAATFDPSRKFSTWIFCIAHNMCKNEYRRMGIRKDVDIELYSEQLLDDAEPCFEEQEIDIEQFTKQLFEELEYFDEIHKTAFLMHYREGFSMKDISQILEISEGTVKSRLFYTRKRLSDRLIKYKKTTL